MVHRNQILSSGRRNPEAFATQGVRPTHATGAQRPSHGLPFLLIPLLAFVVLASCSARPGTEDLKRVREQFLKLRFEASLSSAFKGKSDRELFEMACKNAQVQCPLVLDMLKSQDPAFYAKLQEGPAR